MQEHFAQTKTDQMSRVISAAANPHVRLVPHGLSLCSFFSISLSKAGPVTGCYQIGGAAIHETDMNQLRAASPHRRIRLEEALQTSERPQAKSPWSHRKETGRQTMPLTSG